jgi:hypothetical protein
MSGSRKLMLINFKNGENDIGHIYSVGSGFNRVIELNQKMLILKRFVTKNDFLCDDDN